MKFNSNNVKLLLSAGNISQFPAKVIPQVALSGRSNVGKSSLVNCLLGRKSLARVSSAPGKTITVNFYEVDNKVMLVDLPGYGYAKRTYDEKEQWSALTDGFFTNNKNIDLLKVVVQLVDSKVGITKDDATMLHWMNESDIPYIIAATKIDKLNATEKKKNLEEIAKHPLVMDATIIVPFSAEKNIGRDELWSAIASFM